MTTLLIPPLSTAITAILGVVGGYMAAIYDPGSRWWNRWALDNDVPDSRLVLIQRILARILTYPLHPGAVVAASAVTGSFVSAFAQEPWYVLPAATVGGVTVGHVCKG